MNLVRFGVFLFLLFQFSTISSGCPPDWKSFVDDQGYPDCFRCRECPDGKTAVKNCTKYHDTICDKCTDDEYYDNIPMKCKTCTVCEAGYVVRRLCDKTEDTDCNICPTRTFSLVRNARSCTNCTECNETQVVFQHCNNTVDTICGECTGDEYYQNESLQCKNCTVCYAGQYVKNKCSRFKDSECEICPPGTFSQFQNLSTCTPCKDCNGKKISKCCSQTSDTVCEQNDQMNGNVILALLGVDILISVVILGVCVTHVWRRRGISGVGENHEMESLQGNTSARDTDVNPNKQHTDRRYQRFHTFEQDKMKFTYERPIYIREKSDKKICDVTGIEMVPGDRMVVCDNFNRNNMSVKLIDTKQNIVTSWIKLPSEPWDIALVPRGVTKKTKKSTDDLVVTLPYKEQLRYIRVTNHQITDTNKVISVKGQCRGIQVTGDRKLAISYDHPGRVEIRDLEGQLLTTIERDNGGAELFSLPQYLAVSPGSDILYVSDLGNNTLTSISTRDWSELTKLEGLNYPHGVTVDRAGSVFVCCFDGTVQLVAATGDRATRILGKEDGLCGWPLAICLNPEGDRMYVSDLNSDRVQEFRLTEKDN